MTSSIRIILTSFLLSLFVGFGLAQDAQAPLVSGSFVGADAAHKGEGSFTVTEAEGERSLSLSEDFVTTRGPDLFVWLVSGDDTDDFVNLGRLQSATGAQSYAVPAEVDLAQYDRVVIWCRAFSVLFATADFDQ